MSREPLPERLDPLKLAMAGASLSGTLPNRAMPRFTEGLESEEGETRVELSFELDAAGRATISGRASTQARLICQRCLEEFAYSLTTRFTLTRVSSEEEAERLPEEVDPLLDDETLIWTARLIEDELILALPIIAMHSDPACAGEWAAPEVAEAAEKPNPFAALAKLKRNEY